MLTYRIIKRLFPSACGIADDHILFHSVFVDPYQQVNIHEQVLPATQA